MQLEEALKRVRELDAELLVARNATAEAERKGQVHAILRSRATQPPTPPPQQNPPNPFLDYPSKRCLI